MERSQLKAEHILEYVSILDAGSNTQFAIIRTPIEDTTRK